MATRAIETAYAEGISHQLSRWRGLFDAGFVGAWNDLAVQATEPNAFAESWFLRPALEQFDKAERVQLFTLWDGNQLCGLMPISTLAHYGRWPVPHIQNWMHHNAFLGTPLMQSGYEEAFWQAFLHRLDQEPGQALFGHLRCLTIGGAVTNALEQVCAAQKRHFALVHHTERAFLERGLTPEAYLEDAVRSKKRKELRRQRNRLSEEGVLTFSRDDSDAGIDQWTQEFLLLETRGWKGDNGSALACANETRILFSEILNGASAAGKLERLDLRLNGKPLAMLANFICSPGSFSFKTAFDENYARFSPGVLLQIENLALLEHPDIAWSDSCAVEGHPMIDSLWTGRRAIGRFSVAIGGSARRAAFGAFLKAELAKSAPRKTISQTETRDNI